MWTSSLAKSPAELRLTQLNNGRRKVALFGKTNPLIAPQVIPIELRSVPENVLRSVIGDALEATHLFEKTTNGDQYIAELLRQWG